MITNITKRYTSKEITFMNQINSISYHILLIVKINLEYNNVIELIAQIASNISQWKININSNAYIAAEYVIVSDAKQPSQLSKI